MTIRENGFSIKGVVCPCGDTFKNKIQDMIEILTDSSDLSKIAEKMKSDLVGAEGIEQIAILAEIMNKILKAMKKPM